MRGPEQADIRPSTLQVREILLSQLPDLTHLPKTSAYRAELCHYWSLAIRQQRPAAIVQPTTTDQVAQIVRILNQFPDTPFAIKSGGHDPNVGDASTHGGILVSLRMMKGVDAYDPETKLAKIRPGGCWNDVIGDQKLESHGRTVVGGRLGAVGVGGYLMQGGISFLTWQYGMGADNIVAWETVMPDGSVIVVTPETHPELAVAMRGGGNQFGIVTAFTVRTYPIGKVWGGVRFYSKSQGERIQNAVLRFTLEGAKEEPRAAVIPAETYFFRGFGNYSIVFFYDGETPPTTGSFGELLQIPCFFDWTGVSDYSALLKKLGYGCHYKGRMSFATATVPALPHILPEISTKWRSILQPHFMRTRHALSFWAMTMQPFPSTIGAHTEDRGGNAMGLRASDPDRLILEFSGMWQCKSEDETMRKMSLEIIKWLDEKTPGWVAEARRLREKDGDGDDASEADWHMPLFMNDAMDGQDVTKSYRGFEVFKTMQKSVDPDGLWAKRLGGFKYY